MNWKEHLELVASLGKAFEEKVFSAEEVLIEGAQRGRMLLTCGNGGSAAQADHFVAEWVGRFAIDRPPLRAVSLPGGNATTTALANDFGYASVFSRGVEAFGRAGDMLVALSTSGKSANVHSALHEGAKRGLTTIALTGEEGLSEGVVDHLIDVPSDQTPLIQEVHLMVIHRWASAVEKALF
ncbi:SIS domain-containing protein [bacterium]|nr:SIS domain-containing protein [bacterium]